jgi:hypothetical protein
MAILFNQGNCYLNPLYFLYGFATNLPGFSAYTGGLPWCCFDDYPGSEQHSADHPTTHLVLLTFTTLLITDMLSFRVQTLTSYAGTTSDQQKKLPINCYRENFALS